MSFEDAGEEGDRTTPDRESPVGEPVVRGDPEIAGERASAAVAFDPEDPESVARAAETVREFAAGRDGDNIYLLRGAAACAALVRGEGSYRAATERAGEGVSVSFIRKWARVHDLPRSIRRDVALGDLAPSAAKHVARVGGKARLPLAWAAIDHDLTVKQVREVASAVADGTPIEEAFAARGIDPGELTLSLETDVYGELRRRAALDERDADDLIAAALEAQFED